MANWWAAVGWFSDCNPNANKNNICPYEFKISLSSRRRPAFGGLLSCGGWIYDSIMEMPLLKKVILIGPDEEAFSRVEPEIQEKVEFLS